MVQLALSYIWVDVRLKGLSIESKNTQNGLRTKKLWPSEVGGHNQKIRCAEPVGAYCFLSFSDIIWVQVALRYICVDSRIIGLSIESKNTQNGLRTKKLWSSEVGGHNQKIRCAEPAGAYCFLSFPDIIWVQVALSYIWVDSRLKELSIESKNTQNGLLWKYTEKKKFLFSDFSISTLRAKGPQNSTLFSPISLCLHYTTKTHTRILLHTANLFPFSTLQNPRKSRDLSTTYKWS